jgi:ribosomal-protein-alanine N-acetyltransferase
VPFARALMAARDIDVGLAVDRDAESLAAMARDLIEAGLGWGYRPRRIASLIADKETVTIVARAATRPIGFASMRFGDERAHLVLLAVQPAHQRQGIGRTLVEWLLESASVAGTTSVHVELRAANSGAHAFYRSVGFSETFRVRGYYGGRETAVRMIRMLAVPFDRRR